MMTKFLTLELAIEFYHLVKNYKFHNRVMQDQFNRALLSIPLNLSERLRFCFGFRGRRNIKIRLTD